MKQKIIFLILKITIWMQPGGLFSRNVDGQSLFISNDDKKSDNNNKKGLFINKGLFNNEKDKNTSVQVNIFTLTKNITINNNENQDKKGVSLFGDTGIFTKAETKIDNKTPLFWNSLIGNNNEIKYHYLGIFK